MVTGEKIKINFFFWLGLQISLLSLLLIFTVFAPAPEPKDKQIYVVKPGDNLAKIGGKLGDTNFRKSIFNANKDKISNPNLIYPGQELIIPVSVSLSESFIGLPAHKVNEENKLDKAIIISGMVKY